MIKLYIIGVLVLFGAGAMDMVIEGMALGRPPGIIALSVLVLLNAWVVLGGIALVLS